jgi:hypothetical protein
MKSSYFIGQMNPGIVRIADVSTYENINVKNAPPKYPYHVFFGESAIN